MADRKGKRTNAASPPPPQDPKKKAPGDKSKGFFEGLLGPALSATIGPWFKRKCEEIAVNLPDDSPFKTSSIVKRGFPALTTWLEEQSDGMPPWVGTLVEQFVDGTDAFSAVVDAENIKRKEKIAAAVKDKLFGQIDQLVKSAPARLKDAKDLAAKATEFENIKTELLLLRALNDFAKSQVQPPPTSTPAAPTPANTNPKKSTTAQLSEYLQWWAARRGR